MKRIILALCSATALVACGGGGSSSGGGSGGSTPLRLLIIIHSNQLWICPKAGIYTSTGSNSNGAYVATTGGFYSVKW